MKAKPIVDLDIVIKNNDIVLNSVIDVLKTLGYIHLGEMGISIRDAFKRINSNTPITDSKIKWFNHNLYVCEKGSIGLNNHLALKEHLTKNSLKVIKYSNLKQKLAEKFLNDINWNADGKTDFILNILTEEGVESSATELIEIQNKIQNICYKKILYQTCV